jgi:predicted helicase
VDTFELAEAASRRSSSRKTPSASSGRKAAPIFVIIGNPPYNVGQVNENDNSKNRKYPVMDGRVAVTFAAGSRATNKNALSDPYVKAFRWAADRIGGEGAVALVTNNGFLNGIAFDGMRAHLAAEFDAIYALDLGGNVRLNPKLSGTTHNVFGIQVGVSITLLIRRGGGKRPGRIFYARIDEWWRREEKYAYLETVADWRGVEWQELHPDRHATWLTEGMQAEFDGFLPMGSKAAKAGDAVAIFYNYGRGVATTRDTWAYNFDRNVLAGNMRRTIDFYNDHVHRRQRTPGKIDADSFVTYEERQISWSESLKQNMARGRLAVFEGSQIRNSLYRPFVKQALYFDRLFNERVYQFPHFFPTEKAEGENVVICVPGIGGRTPFWVFAADAIANLSLTSLDATQCFPFYTYNEDGTGRRENITDWALARFRETYGATNDELRVTSEEGTPDSSLVTQHSSLDKWAIFYYIYALLHHPVYRETYAANLRRELPRIPFVRDFRAYARAGARLAEIHVHYERQPEYPLRRVENPDEPLNWRVEKMRLSKDKTQIVYNDFLALEGVPPAAFDYRLGNRSALEWVIDQYRVKTDKRSGITNDPNRADDPEYIVRLIGQVITVSLETVEIVKGLPEFEVLEGDESR